MPHKRVPSREKRKNCDLCPTVEIYRMLQQSDADPGLNDGNGFSPSISFSTTGNASAIVCTGRDGGAAVELESRAKKVAHSRTGSEVAILEPNSQVTPETEMVSSLPHIQSTPRIPKIKKKRSNVDMPNVAISHLPPKLLQNDAPISDSVILQECYIDHVDPYDEMGVRKSIPSHSLPSSTWWSKLFRKSSNMEYTPVHLQDHYPKYFDYQHTTSSFWSCFRYKLNEYEQLGTDMNGSCCDKWRLFWISFALVIVIILCPIILVMISHTQKTTV